MLKSIDRVYQIRRQNKPICILLDQNQKYYVCGFSTPTLCNNVRHSLAPEPNIKLATARRVEIDPIRLKNKNIHDPLLVDVLSTLFIPKKNDDANDKYKVYTTSFDDFAMNPVRHGLGIVYAYQILLENKDDMILRCFVIHPN